MKLKFIFAIFLFGMSLLVAPKQSLAWGKVGHHLVAEIAFHYLDATTQQAVKHYLGRMSIEDAATWMDDNRSNHFYDYMKPWHYINIEQGKNYEPSKERNILTVLNSVILSLEHKETLNDRQIKEYLYILFHLVGDLHQPLHTGYPGDKGGNGVEISSPIYNGNLHSFWDTQIIESKAITLVDCLKLYDGLTPSALVDINKINVFHWMNESRAYLPLVYNFNNGKIDQAYIDASVPVIEKELLIAGLRLASVLKEVFKDASTIAALPAIKEEPPLEVEQPLKDKEQHNVTKQGTIAVEDASKHEGETVTICTKIFGTKFLESAKGTPTFLNAGADYPNSPLTILIWGDNLGKFKNVPEQYYRGKTVCVTGKIVMFKGKPEIIAASESQIVVE